MYRKMIRRSSTAAIDVTSRKVQNINPHLHNDTADIITTHGCQHTGQQCACGEVINTASACHTPNQSMSVVVSKLVLICFVIAITQASSCFSSFDYTRQFGHVTHWQHQIPLISGYEMKKRPTSILRKQG